MARVYAGQTGVQRVARRRRQFLDAGLEVLGTRGWANTTVRGVCDEAGLSTRLFYESFSGLEALAIAIYDEIVDETFAQVAAAVAGARDDRAARAQGAAAALIDGMTGDPSRARVLLIEAFGSAPLAQRRANTMRRLAAVIEQLGRIEYGVQDEADPLIGITAILLAGGISELLIASLDGRLTVTRDRLITDAARLVVAIGDAANSIARDN